MSALRAVKKRESDRFRRRGSIAGALSTNSRVGAASLPLLLESSPSRG